MLRAMLSNYRAVIAVVVVVVLAIVGYWGYAEQQKRAQRDAVTAAIKDTTARLRDSLAVAPNVTGKRSLARIEEHTVAVEGHLKLARGAAVRIPEFADSAEHYFIGAHAILRRQAASIRQSEQSAASRAVLVSHMRRAQRRDAAWIRDAMTHKKTVESRYFDYSLTLKALADLLHGFRDSRKRVEAYVDDSALLELGPAEDARRLVVKESQRVADELDGVRRLALR